MSALFIIASLCGCLLFGLHSYEIGVLIRMGRDSHVDNRGMDGIGMG